MKYFVLLLLAGFLISFQGGAVFADETKVSQPETTKNTMTSPPPTPPSDTTKESGKSGTSSHSETRIPDFLKGKCNNLLGCDHSTDIGLENTYVYEKFIPYFIKTLLNWGAGIAVLMLVFAGVVYLGAAGYQDGLKEKMIKLMMFTVTGLLVMILARAIVSIVENLPLG
jgi:hypothetical protein